MKKIISDIFHSSSFQEKEKQKEYGDLCLGYKVSMDETIGLKGVFSMVELPKNCRVLVWDKPFVVTHIQPIRIVYFTKVKKVSIYWDQYKIYHEHTCCLDRINKVDSVRTILKSFGITGIPMLLELFARNKSVEKDSITIQLWINHFDEFIDLSKY